MKERGSESLLHSYANIASERTVLQQDLRHALHPLLLALVADAVGGAIHLVDGRAKDTGPCEVRAQDNMLHIDNTPFNDEYKLLWLWKKGEPKGPAGQNFTYLPGTNRAARNCLISSQSEPYSTENASIFVTRENLEAVVKLQKSICGTDTATVVEVQDRQPLAVVFAAGSLVHHRYRTAAGLARSCIIMAFHRATHDSVPLFAPSPQGTSLIDRVIGGPLPGNPDAQFLAALAEEAAAIATTLDAVNEGGATRHIAPRPISLDDEAVARWFRMATQAPEVEDLKQDRPRSTAGRRIGLGDVPALLARDMMYYDKHGPLDLILYADSREEPRKIVRNRIREMSIEEMERRLRKWSSGFDQPRLEHILSSEEIAETALEIARHAAGKLRVEGVGPRLVASLERLSTDLAEAIRRPYSLQNFLSTSLFVFWAADELIELGAASTRDIALLGKRMLDHYVALAALVDWHQTASAEDIPKHASA